MSRRLSAMPVALVSLAVLSGCATQRMQLLPGAQAVAVSSPIEKRLSGTTWQGYTVRSVGATVIRSAGLSVGTASGTDSTSAQKLSVTRADGKVVASLDCQSHLEQAKASLGIVRATATRRSYSCTGADYALTLNPTPDGRGYVGTVSWRGQTFEVLSSDDLVDRVKTTLAGFHLGREGRWIASVETLSDAQVFVAPDVRPDEREALPMAILALTTAEQGLAPTNTTSMAGGLVTSSSGVHRW